MFCNLVSTWFQLNSAAGYQAIGVGSPPAGRYDKEVVPSLVDLILHLDGPAILVEPDNIERQSLGSVQFFQDRVGQIPTTKIARSYLTIYIYSIWCVYLSIYYTYIIFYKNKHHHCGEPMHF